MEIEIAKELERIAAAADWISGHQILLCHHSSKVRAPGCGPGNDRFKSDWWYQIWRLEVLLDLKFNVAPKLLHRPKKRFFRRVQVQHRLNLQDFVLCTLASISK
jgi:hypothetical protein